MTSTELRADNRDSYWPDDWGLLLSAFATAYGIGLLSLLALPFLIGSAMATLSLNAAQAGMLSTLEFVGITVSSLTIAPKMDTINRRIVAYSGVLIALTANILSALVDSYEMLTMLRPLAGIGAGLAMACGNATVSNSKNPERFAGQMSVLCVGMVILVALIFPRLSANWGLSGIYTGMVVTIILMAFLMRRLPANAGYNGRQYVTDVGVSEGSSKLPALFVLAAFIAFSLRDTMAWTFVERIGTEVGYSSIEVGNLLSMQAIIGMIGPLIASIVGARYGLKAPVSIGVFLSGVVTYVVSQSSGSQLTYTVAVMCWAGTYFFTLPYLTALAAEIDVKGRVVAASGSALMMGIAIGPAIGGELIVAANGYDLVGLATIICVIMTYLCVLVPLVSLYKKQSYQLTTIND
ncbi:MFS transporter [Pseudomaricurvus alkylphenolicus]|uniref:MFS transporter n=1 Tax=Pseudomaricurvus alkylphenolicus TaxID=1306991 RepID=UPI00141DE2A4|nr:MFS transporter [Pseudomaricurvus alkylphenolicus]NIB43508.1 MFS transporter [Pseudomaricurvus alkylphenolicus]